MPAKNPRVAVVLEPPLHSALVRLARRDGVSVSQKTRDLVRDALDSQEDIALAEVADRRAVTFERSTASSHATVWGTTRRR